MTAEKRKHHRTKSGGPRRIERTGEKVSKLITAVGGVHGHTARTGAA
jgi:hypothetical protein